MFNRRWLGTTVLVLLGTALCVRLGIWQLDRLEGRRAFNDQVRSMRSLPPLDLNTDPRCSGDDGMAGRARERCL